MWAFMVPLGWRRRAGATSTAGSPPCGAGTAGSLSMTRPRSRASTGDDRPTASPGQWGVVARPRVPSEPVSGSSMVRVAVLDGPSGRSAPEDLCLLRVELGVAQDALVA
jgi:hypothetical protein